MNVNMNEMIWEVREGLLTVIYPDEGVFKFSLIRFSNRILHSTLPVLTYELGIRLGFCRRQYYFSLKCGLMVIIHDE